MASNDQILLKKIIADKKSQVSPDLSDGDYFELFVAEQVLKNFDLSYEEIEHGLVGGGNDGGIDCIYTFINGKMIVDDTNISEYRKDIKLHLFIIQAKTSDSFSETAIQKLISSAVDILDLSKTTNSLKSVYREELLNKVNIFRDAYTELATRFPKLSISYVYASQGDSQAVNPNVARQAKQLEETISKLFSDVEFKFEFIGSRDLLRLTRSSPSNSLQLQLLENPISTQAGGYSCLVSLREYYNFITEEGELRKRIFESNVRDYEGDVEVNEEIRETLLRNVTEDFWWLNNGVTIVADKGIVSRKTLTLENAQIVNGLQTTMEIHKYFNSNPRVTDERSILVKVITTENPVSRDKIIKATNSQTRIPAASLRATDEIHRNIEEFFLHEGFYYDRRKNFYKNQSKPKDRIISIPYLAQTIMAIVLKEPNNSRARPSSLLKNKDDYSRVFSENYPIELYLKCIVIMKTVDTYIRQECPDFPLEEKNNLKFHTAMYVTISAVGKADYRPADIGNIDLSTLDQLFLEVAFKDVVAVFRQFRQDKGFTAERTAKSKDFDLALLKNFETNLKKNI